MANSDKNIVITPNRGNTAEPIIVFTGANVNPTTLRTLDDGTLSFEGGTGQLFSISNTVTGNVIFGVNDVTGFPIIEAYANAQIQLNRLGGRLVVGAANTSPTASMTIQGNTSTVGLHFIGQGGNSTGFLTTPSSVRFVGVGSQELALLNMTSLRFSDVTTYSYDSWGGIKWTSANNTMVIGGPGAGGLPNNTVISANLVMHNATTGNFMVANSSATNLIVGANGNIGIGNTTPLVKVSITGAVNITGSIVSTAGANSIVFANATANWISYGTNGVAAPTSTTRSAGTKLVLFESVGVNSVDYGIGIETSHMWFSSASLANGFKWYANTTQIMVSNTTQLGVTGNINYSGTAYATQATLTDGATISWATASAQVATVTIAGNRTVAAPTGMINGAFYALAVIQDATGGRTLAWNAVFKWTGGSAPTLSTAANARDFFVFRSDGTNMYEQGRSLGVA